MTGDHLKMFLMFSWRLKEMRQVNDVKVVVLSDKNWFLAVCKNARLQQRSMLAADTFSV